MSERFHPKDAPRTRQGLGYHNALAELYAEVEAAHAAGTWHNPSFMFWLLSELAWLSGAESHCDCGEH